jgi:tetratricopeptide (TPR) repeat protein
MDEYTEAPQPVVEAPELPRAPRWLLIAWMAVALAAWPVVLRESARRNTVPRGAFVQSLGFLQNRQYPEAIAAARRYLQSDPNSADAFVNIGISYADMGKWDDAILATHRALLIKPDYQLAWNNLRWMLASRDAAHPTPEAFEAEALSSYQAANYRGCIDLARQALKLYPQYTKVFNLLSVCYLNLGMADDAIANAREALRLEPDFELARNNLKLALDRKTKGVVPQNPSVPTADNFLNSSLTNYRAGRMQECINDAQAALKLQPGLAIAYNNIAACSNDLGRPDDAIAAATQALRLQPDFQLARNNLAVALRLKATQQSGRQ